MTNSYLKPWADDIKNLAEEGRNIKQIHETLSSMGCEASYSGIHKFIKRNFGEKEVGCYGCRNCYKQKSDIKNGYLIICTKSKIEVPRNGKIRPRWCRGYDGERK